MDKVNHTQNNANKQTGIATSKTGDRDPAIIPESGSNPSGSTEDQKPVCLDLKVEAGGLRIDINVKDNVTRRFSVITAGDCHK